MLKDIKWIYDDEKLIVRADEKKAQITFIFKHSEVVVIDVDGTEFNWNETSLEALHVRMFGEFVSLHDLMKKAEADYHSYHQESDQNDSDEAYLDAYLHSYEATGRF